MKRYSNFLFVCSFLLSASLVFSLGGCSKEKAPEPEKPVAPVTDTAKEAPPVPQKVTVDFDKVPVSEAAHVVTVATGQGFIFRDSSSVPVSWMQKDMSKEDVFHSFRQAVKVSGLDVVDQGKGVYLIAKFEEEKIPLRLDYMVCERGAFVLFDGRIYKENDFPFSLKIHNKQVFALVPRNVADRIKSATGTQPAGAAGG